MNSSKRKTNVSEAIREIPAMYLMELKFSTLTKLEKKIKQEVDRSTLALRWVQGIKRIKRAKNIGGYNG
ncbi:MAG: hypothetical protein IJX20_00050 [Alphaproteobacteria bacterium]|nr:hypothetical protein [Alphaproteobacteria bacterium]